MRGQVDDLAESPWAAPVWDALERFRDEPLCLPCIDATELTILPGIGHQTASRIIKLVTSQKLTSSDLHPASDAHSIDFIADSLCLSLDQRIILTACTSVNCACPPELHYALARTRIRSADGVLPDATTRIDVDADIGRAGGFVRKTSDTALYGMWLQSHIGPLAFIAGNYTIQSSHGLLFGGSAFARSAIQTVSSVDITPRFRPWTSTWQDGSFFGGAVSYTDTIAHIPTQALFAVSTTEINDVTFKSALNFNSALNADLGGASFCVAMHSTPQQTLVSLATDLDFSSSRVFEKGSRVFEKGSRVFEFSSFRVLGEFLYNSISGLSAVVSSSVMIHNTKLIALARWTLLETGLTIGTQFKTGARNPWRVETTLDIHGTLTKSYGSPLPARGFDLIVDIERQFLKGAVFVARIRYEREGEGMKLEGSDNRMMGTRMRYTTRADVSVQATPTLRIRMRADARVAQYDLERESDIGLLLYADVMWQPTKKLTFRHRTSVFRSTSIDVAAYTAELETDGSMRTFVGSGVGTHALTTLRWNFISALTISIAYSSTTRNNATTQAVAMQLDARLR